ncbi:MAG: hypothetical protein K0R48_810 [Gammaproteobacteria bacterium]|nr:hypothetical protein [Gammaproteobacteria bacterium]
MDPQRLNRIIAALRAFNIPAADGKTLAQRLEGSRTHEYIVLRALLKKHLKFRYNKETKSYECPFVHDLEIFTEIEQRISEQYLPQAMAIYDKASRLAIQSYEGYRNGDIEIIDNLGRFFNRTRGKIIKCIEKKEIERLGMLRQEFENVEREFYAVREHGMSNAAMCEADRIFKEYIDQNLTPLQEYYIERLTLCLDSLSAEKDRYHFRDLAILTFEEEYEGLHGELRLRDEGEELSGNQEARRRDMVTAIAAIEQVTQGNPARSTVYQYHPTQVVRAFLDEIAPIMSNDDIFQMEPRRFLPNPFMNLEYELQSSTQHYDQQLDAALVRAGEELSKSKQYINNIDNINRLNAKIERIISEREISPTQKFLALIETKRTIEKLEADNLYIDRAKRYTPSSLENERVMLVDFIEKNKEIIDSSFEYGDEGIFKVLIRIKYGGYKEAGLLLNDMCVQARPEKHKVRINSKEKFFNYIQDEYGFAPPIKTAEGEFSNENLAEGQYKDSCERLYAKLFNNGRKQLIELDFLIQELKDFRDSIKGGTVINRCDQEKLKKLDLSAPAVTQAVSFASASSSSSGPSSISGPSSALASPGSFFQQPQAPQSSYIDPKGLLTAFQEIYSNIKVGKKSGYNYFRADITMADVMDIVLSNPKIFLSGLRDGAHALIQTLGCTEEQLLSMSEMYKRFKRNHPQYQKGQAFQEFIMNPVIKDDFNNLQIAQWFIKDKDPNFGMANRPGPK